MEKVLNLAFFYKSASFERYDAFSLFNSSFTYNILSTPSVGCVVISDGCGRESSGALAISC